jgi:hypothetical protein
MTSFARAAARTAARRENECHLDNSGENLAKVSGIGQGAFRQPQGSNLFHCFKRYENEQSMYRTLILKFDARVLVLVGALLAIMAVVLPWANLPSFIAGDLARGGVTDGRLLTLGFSVLSAVSLLLPWHPWRRVSLPAAGLAVLSDLVTLYTFFRVIQLSRAWQVGPGAQLGSVGSGLYLTFAGVLLMLVGGLMDVMPTVATPAFALAAAERRWLGYAGWLALVAMLLASCLCAWGAGLWVRSYTVVAPNQGTLTPTFAPAPITYLATPLVGVQLAPLGSNPATSTPVVLPTLTFLIGTPQATLPPLPTIASALPSPTAPRVSQTLPPPTLPVIGGPTVTSTATSTPTSTSTGTPTPTPTPTLPTSPLGTPTLTATFTATATTTP